MSALEAAPGPGRHEAAEAPRTTVCPHGPLLVRGASEWPTPEGGTAPVTRPVVAVCRCDRSQRMPWCDGTHKVVPKGWDDAAPEGQPRAVR